MGTRSNNTGRCIEGLTYRRGGLTREDSFAVFDDLPAKLRAILSQMPARPNVTKYRRIWQQSGLNAAIVYARDAERRFYEAAEAEKASGEYFEREASR